MRITARAPADDAHRAEQRTTCPFRTDRSTAPVKCITAAPGIGGRHGVDAIRRVHFVLCIIAYHVQLPTEGVCVEREQAVARTSTHVRGFAEGCRRRRIASPRAQQKSRTTNAEWASGGETDVCGADDATRVQHVAGCVRGDLHGSRKRTKITRRCGCRTQRNRINRVRIPCAEHACRMIGTEHRNAVQGIRDVIGGTPANIEPLWRLRRSAHRTTNEREQHIGSDSKGTGADPVDGETMLVAPLRGVIVSPDVGWHRTHDERCETRVNWCE